MLLAPPDVLEVDLVEGVLVPTGLAAVPEGFVDGGDISSTDRGVGREAMTFRKCSNRQSWASRQILGSLRSWSAK